MRSKEEINRLLERIAASIDISEELFDKAEHEYQALGKWIDEQTPQYSVSIYPQGSFALGTVIRPRTDKDEYDLDLVCEFMRGNSLSAKELKVDVIKPLLVAYDKTANEIEEKRRCWRVEYEKLKNFHMDIVPAKKADGYIDITDKDEDTKTYDYIGSNPKGYIEWFNQKKSVRYNFLKERAEIEPVKEYKLKTPLQKAIQILKRHRDIMFAEDQTNAPISVIITTITAELYSNEDNIFDTLIAFSNGCESYIDSRKVDGLYYINNPSYTGETVDNFANKWNDIPERAEAFFEWLENFRSSLLESFEQLESDVELANIIGMSLGDFVFGKTYSENSNILNAINDKKEEPITAILPYKAQTIIRAPHREKAPWSLPKGSRVIISAMVTSPNGKSFSYSNDGEFLDKNCSINFRASFGGIKKPYTLKWQITNIGDEARQKNGLRGGFELSTDVSRNLRHESTEYSGSHAIQCFITRGGNQCIAKSDIFIVNIK